MATKPKWIPENDAAKMMGLQPRTLRRLCQSGGLAVNFTHFRNRNFQYDEIGLTKVLNQKAAYPARA